MSEIDLIKELKLAIDLILNNDSNGLNVRNVENQQLLAFVNLLTKIDYSSDSKIEESLKKRLIKKLNEQSSNGELSDAELDCAAGGLDNSGVKKYPEK